MFLLPHLFLSVQFKPLTKMNNIPYYSGNDVRASLKYSDLIPVLEEALADFSRGPDGGVNQPFRATAEVKKFNG